MPSARNQPEGDSHISADKSWVVYIIISSDDKLYTGISNNPAKRWHAHNHTKQAAKFFRGRTPKTLAYLERGHNRSSASQREAQIKKLSRQKKLQLLDSQSELDWHLELGLSQS
ncbi:MAG: endonuclease [Cellvibrionaceae bacterium]|nr:endonuclease [Cellvibrionaceae bacterium]